MRHYIFSTCLALDRKGKRAPDSTQRELPLNKLTDCICGKHGVKHLFHSTEPQGKQPLFSFPLYFAQGPGHSPRRQA